MYDFWNADGQQTIMGLDVLGVRQADQAIERDWVSNITTISNRVRYLSLLAWAVTEHYLRLGLGGEEASDRRVDPSRPELVSALERLEFVIVAATLLADAGEGAELTLLIGRDKYQVERDTLQHSGSVTLPGTGRSSMLGTYFMPALGFGLLQATPDGAFVRVMPRGVQLHKIKQARLRSSTIVEKIFEGGTLTMEEVKAEWHEFSVNALPHCADERDELLHCMWTPYSDDKQVAATYHRFLQTVTTAFRTVDSTPASSTELITRAYLGSVEAQQLNEVEMAWASYELHRRVHHALELLFSSLVEELNSRQDSTVREIVSEWQIQAWMPAEVVSSLLPWPERPLEFAVGQMQKLAPQFLTTRLTRPRARALPSTSRALYALSMLVSDAAFSRPLRTRISPRKTAAATVNLVEADPSRSAADLLIRILEDIVVPEHLATSLRKMSQGGKPTLRFYQDQGALRSTGNAVLAGFSGDRLANVLGCWADMGALERHKDRRVQLTPWGRGLLQEVQQ